MSMDNIAGGKCNYGKKGACEMDMLSPVVQDNPVGGIGLTDTRLDDSIVCITTSLSGSSMDKMECNHGKMDKMEYGSMKGDKREYKGLQMDKMEYETNRSKAEDDNYVELSCRPRNLYSSIKPENTDSEIDHSNRNNRGQHYDSVIISDEDNDEDNTGNTVATQTEGIWCLSCANLALCKSQYSQARIAQVSYVSAVAGKASDKCVTLQMHQEW